MLRFQDEDEAKDWVSTIQKAILSAEQQAELDLHKSKVCARHSVLGLEMTPALSRTFADKHSHLFPSRLCLCDSHVCCWSLSLSVCKWRSSCATLMDVMVSTCQFRYDYLHKQVKALHSADTFQGSIFALICLCFVLNIVDFQFHPTDGSDLRIVLDLLSTISNWIFLVRRKGALTKLISVLPIRPKPPTTLFLFRPLHSPLLPSHSLCLSSGRNSHQLLGQLFLAVHEGLVEPI